jgi:threonine dehydrogenase-like Zn-dependent dehydrogenase
MKALFLHKIGDLSLSEVEKPLPRPDELLVRIEACGICGTDRHLFLGEFPSKPPVTIGHEFAGVIEAVGSESRLSSLARASRAIRIFIAAVVRNATAAASSFVRT